ncbi:hypothetical protein M413DRAFT_259729 [Hebeloma cylindrosporum]|uniref:Uncharacterized protein n=1 Tax=Hebeloma cylindrosporum TaxID=76867 RepID=A0A0C3CRZ0_HEBCY|nr:hypothetical protein M413DRAFT_259729 [Hebeloma cylindrosporum h7]
MFAKFEVRRLELPAVLKILGTAIGMCPKEALFKRYIDLEVELREFDRARTWHFPHFRGRSGKRKRRTKTRMREGRQGGPWRSNNCPREGL